MVGRRNGDGFIAIPSSKITGQLHGKGKFRSGEITSEG